MYTSIPMPAIRWEEKNLKYCMCFLPAAGLIAGAAQWLLLLLCRMFSVSDFLYAALFCALTVLITGGIHIDGLIDTSDALGSHGTKEKKLQILADPHAGAFGIAGVVLYFLVLYGTAVQLRQSGALENTGSIAAVFSSFLISRALTAIFVVYLPPSKKSGLLYTFSSVAAVKAVTVSSIAVLALCAVLIVRNPGVSALLPAAAAALCAAYFVRMVKKKVRRHFGEISADGSFTCRSCFCCLALLLRAESDIQIKVKYENIYKISEIFGVRSKKRDGKRRQKRNRPEEERRLK